MPEKQIVVLANSIKKYPARCVAGREIVETDDAYTLGDWVRPISTYGREGALSLREITLDRGGVVSVLDFVEISMAGPVGDPCQPENWTIKNETWTNIGNRFQVPTLDILEEHPPDLWLQPDVETDRVAHAYLQEHCPAQSLYCIRPETLTLSFFTNRWGGAKRRVFFTYNGAHYDLGLTDPIAEAQHCRQIPAQSEPPHNVQLDVQNHLLCVSLAGDFNGWHYKLVAAVLSVD